MMIYIRSNEGLFNALRRFNPSLSGIVQNDMWISREQVEEWYNLAIRTGLKNPLLFRVVCYIEMCARSTDDSMQRPHHVCYNP